MRRLPIRLRLTAWYVLVLAAVLSALGAFVVTGLRSDLTSEVDRSLTSAADQIAEGYHREGAPEFVDTTRSLLAVPGRRESGAQVLSADGRVVLSDGDPVLGTALLDVSTVARVLGGERILASYRTARTGEHLRALAIPVRRAGRNEALVAAESLEEVDDAVDRVVVLLLIGGIGALALAAAGGWWVARKGLRPVEEMTNRADRIDIDDLSQRIPVPPARDEVAHLARTLNAMLERLQEGVVTREQFVADASHELRAPLAAMRAELEVSLRHDDLDADARATLSSTREEVVRMGRIVDNLLTLARVDGGRLDLLATPHDLCEIAERAARTHEASAAAAGVEIVIDGDATTVAVDPDRIEQVFSNLIDNAIRVAPRGSAVTIAIWRSGREVGARVCDDGPGVPEQDRERIFERFSRHDPARARASGGAGLGLAISAEIVRAHQGRLWVEGRKPRGAAFVVALPIDERASASDGGPLALPPTDTPLARP